MRRMVLQRTVAGILRPGLVPAAACSVALLILLGACGGDSPPFAQPATPTPILESPTRATPSPTVADECRRASYTVASGDTLLGIAIRFDTTVGALVSANALEDPDVLALGDQLEIPCPDEGLTPPPRQPAPVPTPDDAEPDGEDGDSQQVTPIPDQR